MTSLPHLLQAADELSVLMAQRPTNEVDALAQDLVHLAQAQQLGATAAECRTAAERALAGSSSTMEAAAETTPETGLSVRQIGSLQTGAGTFTLGLAAFMLNQPVSPVPVRSLNGQTLGDVAGILSAKLSVMAHDMGYLGLMGGGILLALGLLTLGGQVMGKSSTPNA